MAKKSVFVVTATTPVNAETIRQALESDSYFMEQPPFVREGVLSMVPLMPAALADWFDRPVTTENIVRAKLVFMRLCLENGFVENVVKNMPGEMLERLGLTLDEFGEEMRFTLQMIVDGGDELVAQMVEAVKATGMNDSQLIQANSKLPKAVKKAEREGWLTIGRMLLLCPSSITENDQ